MCTVCTVKKWMLSCGMHRLWEEGGETRHWHPFFAHCYLPSTTCKTGSYLVWILWLNEGSASGGAERVKHRHNRRRFQLCCTLCMHLKDSKILISAWHEFPEKQKIREMKSRAWHSHWGPQRVLVSQRAQMAELHFQPLLWTSGWHS